MVFHADNDDAASSSTLTSAPPFPPSPFPLVIYEVTGEDGGPGPKSGDEKGEV